MIDFLVIQIRLGKITLDDVPEKFKNKVEQRLNAK